jgi:hypothetical protein
MATNRHTYDEELDKEFSAVDSQTDKDTHQRIKREVIIVTPDDDTDEEQEDDNKKFFEVDNEDVDSEDEMSESDEDNEEEETEDDAKREQKRTPKEKSLMQHIITGSLLTEGTMPYYRYFIAIAVMCFLSIFLTFLSLNTNHELRRKEKQTTLLHERSVIKDEVRYEVSSKSEITKRLKEQGIELVDLSKSSRLVEK